MIKMQGGRKNCEKTFHAVNKDAENENELEGK